MEILKDSIKTDIFDGKVNMDVIYQVVKMYQACKRRGTASTKTRAEVSGGGKKPWRQKGTGRARFGSIRNPIWRGGGAVFGPKPRDYSYAVPKRIRLQALKSSINSKINDDSLILVDKLEVSSPRTKEFLKIIDGLKISTKALFVVDKLESNLKLAARNLKNATLKDAYSVNALDILLHDKLVLTKAGMDVIEKRLTRK